MTCIELHDTGQNSEKQRFGYPWLSKTFQTHPLKSVEAEPCFRKVSLPLQNYICFSRSPQGQRVLATNLLPLTGPGMRPTVQNSSKPRMSKGQLSRVPLPGNSWMPFTFQPALCHFSNPTNIHTHSSQLLTLNQHITSCINPFCFLFIYLFFFFSRGFSILT